MARNYGLFLSSLIPIIIAAATTTTNKTIKPIDIIGLGIYFKNSRIDFYNFIITQINIAPTVAIAGRDIKKAVWTQGDRS